MAYRELLHADPHVACLWIADAPAPGNSRRVLPDACVDVVWNGAGLGVAGPATAAVVAGVPPGERAVGLRFRVGAAGAALGLPAGELLDTSVRLEDVWGAYGAALAERVGSAPPDDRPAVLAAGVGARLPRAGLDAAVRAAALALSRPDARVERLGGAIGIGERHLRRRFAAAVGYSPKTLHRILRFQRFLRLARDLEDPAAPASAGRTGDLAGLAFAAGYADQAHLTRECRRLSGLTPVELLASGAGPAGELRLLSANGRL